MDLIDRQAAIDALDTGLWGVEWDKALATAMLEDLPSAQPEITLESAIDYLHSIGWMQEHDRILTESAQPEQRWIPCSERLPEEDVEVLITYRYKEGEGDTSHADIDITTYGQMYFGGNKVGNHKHWRQPFEYFESNYEVVAWMPLPEPYKDGEHDE